MDRKGRSMNTIDIRRSVRKFIVVEDKAKLEELSGMSPYATPVKRSAVSIIVLGNDDCMRFPELWEQDLSAATQNILLEAVEQGLGTVWLGVSPEKDRMDHITNLFGLGKGLKPFSVIAIGYPEDEEANHFVDRYDKVESASTNSFGH